MVYRNYSDITEGRGLPVEALTCHRRTRSEGENGLRAARDVEAQGYCMESIVRLIALKFFFPPTNPKRLSPAKNSLRFRETLLLRK